MGAPRFPPSACSQDNERPTKREANRFVLLAKAVSLASSTNLKADELPLPSSWYHDVICDSFKPDGCGMGIKTVSPYPDSFVSHLESETDILWRLDRAQRDHTISLISNAFCALLYLTGRAWNDGNWKWKTAGNGANISRCTAMQERVLTRTEYEGRKQLHRLLWLRNAVPLIARLSEELGAVWWPGLRARRIRIYISHHWCMTCVIRKDPTTASIFSHEDNNCKGRMGDGISFHVRHAKHSTISEFGDAISVASTPPRRISLDHLCSCELGLISNVN